MLRFVILNDAISEPGGERQGKMRVSPRYFPSNFTLSPGSKFFSKPESAEYLDRLHSAELHRGRSERECARHMQRGAAESGHSDEIRLCAVRDHESGGGHELIDSP